MKFSLLGLALIGAAQADTIQCAADGAQAVDSLADAAIKIWATTKRCDEQNVNKNGNAVKCEIDITSAAQSIGNMANTIVGATAECGVIDTEASGCGMLVGKLLAATAGLASRAGGIVDKCPNKLKPTSGDILDQNTRLGKCIMNAKNSMRGVFKIMQGFTHLKDDEDHEAAAAGILTDFGAYLADAVNDCSGYDQNKDDGNEGAACAAAALGLVSELDRIGTIGEELAHTCSNNGARLYLNQKISTPGASSSLTLALACFLPVTAVLSFIVGLRFAKARSDSSEEARFVHEDLELTQ